MVQMQGDCDIACSQTKEKSKRGLIIKCEGEGQQEGLPSTGKKY